ncbi:MAG TPA: J domain-containing protein [Nitrospirota bacterium]|nr:J domain-containing protein [Nitrospirota bacterium]
MITESDVIAACRTIFGNQVTINRNFLITYLRPSCVKSAYRKLAKENHPDLFTKDPVHVQEKQTALFRDILAAYVTLNLFFRQREQISSSLDESTKPERTPAYHRTSDSLRQSHSGTYYTGMIPKRILHIGQYLYYRGEISFSTMLNALICQRKQRPSVGDIALQWGWLDAVGLGKILGVRNRPILFGEKAVLLHLLSAFQVNTILSYQRSHQARLGDFFVQQNILSADQIDNLVQDLKDHNAAVHASRVAQSHRHH